MKLKYSLFLTLFAGSAVMYMSSCGGGNSAQNAQSVNNGLTLFETNCSACHQKTGEGMANMYPPLKGSDLLKKNPTQIACIIKNGLNGKLVVNGKEYNNVMAPLAGLSAQEVADISNYVLNNFNQLDTYVDADKVTKLWENCK